MNSIMENYAEILHSFGNEKYQDYIVIYLIKMNKTTLLKKTLIKFNTVTLIMKLYLI